MKKIIICNTILFCCTTALFAQNNGSLNLSKGQKYMVENKVVTTSTSEAQGQSIESSADVTTTYKIDVTDAKDNYKMTNVMSGMKMNMTTMGQNVTFDSEKKEDMDGNIGASLKNYLNQPNNVVMDKSGNIIAATKKDTAAKSEATSAAEMMMQQMGSDPAKQGYGAKMAFMVLPKNAKVGTSWTDSVTENGITRVSNYSVKEISGKSATVAVSGTESRDSKMEMQGMEVNTKTKGKFSGEEVVDMTTGVILKNNSTADAAGNIYVMGQEIPTTIKATSVTTVSPL